MLGGYSVQVGDGYAVTVHVRLATRWGLSAVCVAMSQLYLSVTCLIHRHKRGEESSSN